MKEKELLDEMIEASIIMDIEVQSSQSMISLQQEEIRRLNLKISQLKARAEMLAMDCDRDGDQGISFGGFT